MLVPLERPSRDINFGGVETWLTAKTPAIDKSLRQSITDIYMVGALLAKNSVEVAKTGDSDKSRRMKAVADKWTMLASALENVYKNQQRLVSETIKTLE